jgi:hypothetical protein
MPARSFHGNPSAAEECTRPATSTSTGCTSTRCTLVIAGSLPVSTTSNRAAVQVQLCAQQQAARGPAACRCPGAGRQPAHGLDWVPRPRRRRGRKAARGRGVRPVAAPAPKRGAVVPAPLPKSRTAASFQHARAYLTSSPPTHARPTRACIFQTISRGDFWSSIHPLGI